ncbi:MAG TPA: primosomal protein N', partial [Candidatus Saccharimonadales bacterium]|nr:primosomal protein N' [Candidatus Saccharimonadales bacterium]
MPQPNQYLLVSPLDYGATDRFALTYAHRFPLPVGTLVEVPLGRKTSLGVVTAPAEPPQFATKALTQALDLVTLPPHLVQLAEWLHSYYQASPKSIWQTILPSGLLTKRRDRPAAPAALALPKLQHALTPEQTSAIAAITGGSHTAYLLQGVTGSGKTQVYIELAKMALAAGRSVIIMVPEIALAPQIEAHFRAVFGEVVVATHSRMTPAQRHQAWAMAARTAHPQVVIGPRSSLFLPLAQIGLIVIDEAHETSYKQEQAPRYQAVTAAAKLAGLTGAKLVLGSATPSLSELYLVERGRIGLAKLTVRANRQPPPPAVVVDLRDKSLAGPSRFISRPLAQAIEATLGARRQSLLFLNRRGSASSQICADCGRVAICPDCGLALTFHADALKLICHVCNYRMTPAAVCPAAEGGCGSSNLRYLGCGTKRIEAEVRRLFPAARLARLDKDSATPRYLDEVYAGLYSGTI